MEDHTNSPAKRDQTKAVHEAEGPQFLLARTLQEVSALLTTQLNLDEVLERLLDLLGIVVRYDSASIQLIGPDGELSLAAGRGYPDIERAQQAVHDLSSHILQFQWAEVKIIVIPDTYSNPDWIKFPGTDYIRSWLGAPLLVKGQFIGCLALDSRTPNEYNLAIGETVATFANQAALAIENTRLFEAERTARAWAEAARQAEAERASELEAVRQATLGLTASLELHQVLDSILISTLTLLP
ncbi:MAG TPA: GAF domain-containing protein, partial [Anaerolineales bacterium]